MCLVLELMPGGRLEVEESGLLIANVSFSGVQGITVFIMGRARLAFAFYDAPEAPSWTLERHPCLPASLPLPVFLAPLADGALPRSGLDCKDVKMQRCKDGPACFNVFLPLLPCCQ